MLAKLFRTGEEIMRRFIVAILVAATAIYSSAHDVVLAQTATTPNVVPPFVGLSTPVTSTVTNCMMSTATVGLTSAEVWRSVNRRPPNSE